MNRRLFLSAVVAAALLPAQAFAITATSLDMELIAGDTVFANRVKALTFAYCDTTVQSETANNHTARRSYCQQILNNPNTYIPNLVWAAASNQTLANDVVTTLGRNFTASDTTSTIAGAVTTATPLTTGATDTDINNAVAAAFNAFANA